MATTTSATVIIMSKLGFSCNERLKATPKKQTSSIKFHIINTNLSSSPTQSTTIKGSSFSVKAYQQDPEENITSYEDDKEDLNYLWKLLIGSIMGAAFIKYGSVLFPEITRPNIVQALTMITAPVVVALLFLFKQSLNKQ
ncbi:hypothetical protein ACFE04_013413 [Oxalis oulophora]